MFREYFAAHPLASLLLPGPQDLWPPAGDRAWKDLGGDQLKEIREKAEEYAKEPYPLRRATDFLAFTRTGSRKADEEGYFFRRRKLCWASLLCCIDEDASADDVIDGLWCICEETSWVISAHNVNPIPGAPRPEDYPLPDPDRPYVDLFAAQTGMILAIVCRLLGDRLDAVSPLIRRRAQREIQRRILRPFMENDDFWWMGFRRKDLNNWTPWIVSNIMAAACTVPLPGDIALPALMERALGMADRWLDVVPDDGGCDEGAGYWNMAGGALADCVWILERMTGGRADLWGNEKLRAVASFPLKAEIGNGWFVNFADCDARPFLSGERLQYAGERMHCPALTALGHRHRGTLSAQLDDVPHLTRLLCLLFSPDPRGRAEEKADVWLPCLEMRVVRRGDWTLCCKGGHNGESHNHNDVGSFMLYLEGQPVIVDAGNMTYTAATFSDRRYTLWNVRSAFHNLPMPLLKEQVCGDKHRAEDVRCLPDGLSLDMAAAWDCPGILQVHREMRLRGEGLAVHDTVCLAQEGGTAWVLMLRNAPELLPGKVLSGPVLIEYPDIFTAACEAISVDDPRMARNFPGSLYRVTITSPARSRADALFCVRRIQ